MRGIDQARNLQLIHVPEMFFPRKLVESYGPEKVEQTFFVPKSAKSRQKVHIFDIWSEADLFRS